MPNIRKSMVNMCSKTAGYALSGMTLNERNSLAKHIGNQRSAVDMSAFSQFAKAVVGFHDGITNTLWTNGEKVLIDRTGQLGFKTLFDVGANVGKWSELAYEAHAEAHVHAFEIVPDTFRELQRRIAKLSNRVSLNPFGLSDTNGIVDVRVDPASNLLSSMLDFEEVQPEASQRTCVRCPVRRGEDVARTAGIEQIDFLKIDVEGAESSVLRGFENLISSQRIRLVQFEYNRGAIVSKFLLRDFYEFFEPKGYQLGKLYPDGVRFHDYSFDHEDFQGPNYVACLKSDTELASAISL